MAGGEFWSRKQNSAFRVRLGEIMRAERARRGMSHAELALEAGMATISIRQIEGGGVGGVITLLQILYALDASDEVILSIVGAHAEIRLAVES